MYTQHQSKSITFINSSLSRAYFGLYKYAYLPWTDSFLNVPLRESYCTQQVSISLLLFSLRRHKNLQELSHLVLSDESMATRDSERILAACAKLLFVGFRAPLNAKSITYEIRFTAIKQNFCIASILQSRRYYSPHHASLPFA